MRIHPRPWTFPAFRAIALLAVVAVTFSGCGSSTTATWPTAQQARDQLSKKFGYNFVPYQDRYRAANASLQLQITTPQDPTATDNMVVAVYYGKWTTYAQDIDNVFSVIAPDAETWAHAEEAKLISNSSLNETYDAKYGQITCVWNNAIPSLSFIFTGN